MKQIPRWLAYLTSTTALIAASNDWPKATPESVGLDSSVLSEMFEYIREHRVPVHSVQIVRQGKLALDAYFFPFAPTMRHDVASVTKSITSTLVGQAIDHGRIPSVRTPLIEFFQDRAMVAAEPARRITLEDLLTMRAGWDCGFETGERRLFEMRASKDWAAFMLALPAIASPGTRFAYCSGNCHLLSLVLSQTAGRNALNIAREELFGPLGITDVRWTEDPWGNNHGWGDLQMHPRDMAKIGQLFLQSGEWQGRRVLSEEWVRTATRAHVDRTTNQDRYGYFWWVKGADFPGMFEAVGRGGQRINVWPARDLVLVFTGAGFEPGDVAPFILKALRKEPLPENAKAQEKLTQKLAEAGRAPLPRAAARRPKIVAQIDGRRIEFPPNGSGWSQVTLSFVNESEGRMQIIWDGKEVTAPLGLDALPRFAVNPLNELPQAGVGEWIDERAFLVRLDLIGGINSYALKLMFALDGDVVEVEVEERSGLAREKFRGRMRGP
jgi:CubicO group peptidase (beta-lactamase class C family)